MSLTVHGKRVRKKKKHGLALLNKANPRPVTWQILQYKR